MTAQYITAQEMAEILKVSESKAYKIIKQLNEELSAKGFFILSGRVPEKFFRERFYIDQEEKAG